MSVVVVPADPPREGLVLPELPETSPLSTRQAADLYAAALKDVAVAVSESGGNLLVNYRPDDLLPDHHRVDESAEAAVRATVATALGDLDDVRFEKQVGSTYSARIGNTVTHLLESEDPGAVLVVDPTAMLAGRTVVDAAGMKSRTSEVVLGPAPGGRLHLAGFTEPVDFEDAFATAPLSTVAERATAAGFGIDFVEFSPVVETGADLTTLVSVLRARLAAGRAVPDNTTEVVEALDLRVVDGTVSAGTEGT
ncbi:hypothetical protein BRC81_11595 [Halobacteriales archaeon QS_1_68_20]|nr:MAG: hypothetical protein BRC81_11595 [Halobacteriales archaeon QS_1_68_20]